MSDKGPTRRTPAGDPADLLRKLATEARNEAVLFEKSAETISAASVLALLAEMGRRRAVADRTVSRVAAAVGLPKGAKDRIRWFLVVRVGMVVDKDEISGVAGIHEWARRIRELRLEEGLPINSSQTRDDLRPGQYVLEATQPDVRIRDRWEVANEIRRSGGTASDRVLRYFQANVGNSIAKDEIAYAANVRDHSSLVQELVHDGWQIESSVDNSELQPGQYRMTNGERLHRSRL
jgi:hypothetical protein